MTYVTDQTPAELRAHMKRLISMPGWHEPLADRLYKEILALDEQIAAWNCRQDDADLADAERMTWQPMETAPKDGHMFLCWVNAVTHLEDDEGRHFLQDVSDHDFCRWTDSGGYFDNMMGSIGDQQVVTHWMPLPAPPKT